MFIMLPATASDLSQSALYLLVAIVARVPSESEASISQQDLAVAIKASRSTIQRALLELQQVGLVEVIHRGAGLPILRLPWRESSTPTKPSKTAGSPAPDVEQRFSSIEARLLALESKQSPTSEPAPTKAVKSPASSAGSLNAQRRGRR